MSCGNPFCTCCQTSYLEGLCDGYRLGYRRGYVHGYADGALGLDPPAAYQNDILRRIEQLNKPRLLHKPSWLQSAWEREHESLMLYRAPRICTCIGVCTCI